MKFLKNKQQRSIRGHVQFIFLCVVLIMGIGFYISFSMKSAINQSYEKSMHMNRSLSDLSIKINQTSQYFERYLKNRDVVFYQQYANLREEVQTILIHIKDDMRKDPRNAIYYRNLENMFDYHKNIVNQILLHTSLDMSTYEHLMKLKTLFMYMNNHSEMMATTYLDYSANQYNQLLKDYGDMEKNMYMIFVLFGLLSFGFALALSNDILKTIEDFSKSAEHLSNAEWGIKDMKTNSYKELSKLAKAFNNMKQNIKNFIDELNEKSELENRLNQAKLKNSEQEKFLKETQLKSLQMQMDPHFLFNTLNTVSRTAMFEDAKDTVTLIEAVSKILRYNLTHMGKLVSLKKEVDVLKAYTVIQETRFQDQMKFYFTIPSTIDTVQIPPMTIQPIVENAIIHGLAEKDKDGKIYIRIIKEKEYVTIEVEDNGKGIDKERLELLKKNEKIDTKWTKGTGLGIFNLKQRLKLYFDQKDLVGIESQKGEGTKVYIKVPVKGVGNFDQIDDC